MTTALTTSPSGPSTVLTQNHQRTFTNAAAWLNGSSLATLPYELLFGIFEYLKPADLVQASQVCQDFYAVANDGRLWKRFATFYDESFWNRCIDTTGLDFTGDSITWNRFKASVVILSQVKTEGTSERGSNDIVVLTLPKGLSLELLDQRAKTTTKGNKIGFRTNYLSDDQKNARVTATEVVFMKKFLIEGSRMKTRTEHETLADSLGCVIPDVKAVAALAFLTYIGSPAESPTRLLSDNPWTYSRCKGDWFFGGFAPGGPCVHFLRNFVAGNVGLVPLRKF